MKFRLFAALFAASGFALAALQSNPVSAVKYGEANGTLYKYVPEELTVDLPATTSVGWIEPGDGGQVFKATQTFRVMTNKNAPNIDIGVYPQALSTPFNSAVGMKVGSMWDGKYATTAFRKFYPASNTWQSVDLNFMSDVLNYTQTNESMAIAGEYRATVNYKVTSH